MLKAPSTFVGKSPSITIHFVIGTLWQQSWSSLLWCTHFATASKLSSTLSSSLKSYQVLHHCTYILHMIMCFTYLIVWNGFNRWTILFSFYFVLYHCFNHPNHLRRIVVGPDPERGCVHLPRLHHPQLLLQLRRLLLQGSRMSLDYWIAPRSWKIIYLYLLLLTQPNLRFYSSAPSVPLRKT